MTPTTKQITFAQSLYSKHAATNKRVTGFVMPHADFREHMTWMGYDPNNKRDVSRYIDGFMRARIEAQIAVRTGR